MANGISKKILRLKNYNNSPAPILSVYFQLPLPKKYSKETIVNKLQSVINANLTVEQREEMKQNIAFIVGFMEKYQQERGIKTIALFSGGDNLFEIMHLPYAIENTARYAHSPYLEPLLLAQEDTRRYFVIMNDREKAIFYTLYSGNLEEQKVVTAEDVPQDVKGRWPDSIYANREDKIQRHIHDHLNRHFDEIAKKAESFIKGKEISGVILGGHKSELSQFEKHLPKPLKDKVVGKFVSELKVNFNQILHKSQKVVDDVNQQFNHGATPSTVSY